MTAQAAQNFSKFSRPAFGFSSKSRMTAKTEENDEDWYIPYNGPYEAPRELPNRRKARDSWGDPLDDEEDTIFNDKELHLRYGGIDSDRHHDGERMGRGRDRTFSATSGQSVSSGTIDPSRPSIGYRRSTVSSGTRHVLPSYISMDAAGGVGESPIPPPRSSQERNRTTLSGIFNFNAHSRKEDSHDYQQPPSDPDRQRTSLTKWVHPYARAIPRKSVEMPSKAPLIHLTNSPGPATSHNPSNNIKPYISSLTRVTSPILRNSASTPELRYSALHDAVVIPDIQNANLISQPIAMPQFVVPKAKDRWLSAETWCDAVLFPRPRLKTGIVPSLEGRIVSPPGSPVQRSGSTGTQEPSVVSRVLAHSRSLMDLNRPVGSSSYSYPPISTSEAHERDPRPGLQSTIAQNDLSVSTPVPSLRRVLEQGEQLANDRKAWQMQAQSSFGNKQARTLVKARSKSLANGRRRGHQAQNSLDYLAAQACLGNQNFHPTLSTTDLYTTNAGSSRKNSHSKNASLAATLSKSSKSHSRNDSWSRPAVKMAMSTAAICGFPATDDEVIVRERGDARAASLEGAIKRDGTKVIRLADPVHLPVDHRGPRPINASPDSSIRRSPSPSNGSDRRVAVALGTPPLRDDQSDFSFHPSHPYAQGGLSFSVPGPSSQTRIDRGVGFAGPHPSINSGVDVSLIPDTLARHKLPPHLYLHPYVQGFSRDSYFDKNGLLAQFRSGDETPHQNKMWAQLSPGVLREVLPNDIQYSPFTPSPENNISPVSAYSRNSIEQINDTIGVGVTLANAESVRRSPAGRTGTNDADSDIIPISQVDGDRQSQDSLPERTIRQPIEHNLAISEDSDATVKPPLTNQIVSSSIKQRSSTPTSPSDRAVTISPTVTSSSSSPPHTPRRLGSLNDLDGFQDLFYRPSNDLQRTPMEAALPDTPAPPHLSKASWDHVRRNKAESGLTSLARHLSEEFELITQERERLSRHSSIQTPTPQQMGTLSRQLTVRSYKFVSEEASHPELVPELERHAIQAFRPSDSLPEDIESSRASSDIESTDETAVLRLGVVESILTPVTVSPQHRPNSYAGETTSATNNESFQQDLPTSCRTTTISGEASARTLSSLIPPVSRSSYMTTSTASRMSGLSDFPVPPRDHRLSESRYVDEPLPPPFTEQQLSLFGSNQDGGDLVKTSSSSS